MEGLAQETEYVGLIPGTDFSKLFLPNMCTLSLCSSNSHVPGELKNGGIRVKILSTP